MKLFRWRDDPDEANDLAPSLPDQADRSRQRLEAKRREILARKATDGGSVNLSDEDMEHLRKLGYAGEDE